MKGDISILGSDISYLLRMNMLLVFHYHPSSHYHYLLSNDVVNYAFEKVRKSRPEEMAAFKLDGHLMVSIGRSVAALARDNGLYVAPQRSFFNQFQRTIWHEEAAWLNHQRKASELRREGGNTAKTKYDRKRLDTSYRD